MLVKVALQASQTDMPNTKQQQFNSIFNFPSYSEICFLDDEPSYNYLNTMVVKFNFPELQTHAFPKVDLAFQHIIASPEKNRLLFLDKHIGPQIGFDLLDKLNHLNITNTTVVMLTTCEAEESIAEAFSYSMVKAYIIKPLSIELVEWLTGTQIIPENKNLSQLIKFKA